MKRTIKKITALGIAVIALSNHSSAQWLTTGNALGATGFLGSTTNQDVALLTNNTSRMYISKTGNIGIGINTPAFLLDVFSAGNASANFKSSTGTANLIIDRGNSAATSSVSYRTAGVPTWQTGTVGNDNFNIRNIALGAPALTILATNSNVGIGINAPVNKLSVAGGADFTGNVGIGITAPTYKLEVTADASFNGVRIGLGNANQNGNTVVGAGAMAANVSGVDNVALGNQSMAANISGSNNVAVGRASMAVNTTGTSNSALGWGSLNKNTTGFSNAAFGAASLNNNTTGVSNTACGKSALENNTTGAVNSAFGVSALAANTTGNYNSAIGAGALNQNTTGNDNIAFGRRALEKNSTGNYNVAIGDSALVTLTAGNELVAVGHYALMANTAGYQVTAVGHKALYSNTTGYQNTAIGYNALLSDTAGYRNTATGALALTNNTSGNANTANGYNALNFNTTGTINCAFGSSTLALNTTGNYNSAFGAGALNENTTGNDNNAMGRRALLKNTTGNYNVGIGDSALVTCTTGSYNTTLGSFADIATNNLQNATAIGYTASVDADNKVRVGNTSVTSIGGQVAWTNFSDARIKDKVQENIHGMDFINALRPVTFHYNVAKTDALLGVKNEQNWDGKKDIEKIAFSGFLAQEVDAAAQSVGYDFSGVDKTGNVLGLRYSEFVVPIVKGMQELSKENEELKAKNEKLENEIAEIKSCVESLCNKQSSEKVSNSELQAKSSLMQNQPNPFNQSTVISYQLSGESNNGRIIIRDLNGNLVQQVKIAQSGKGQVTINANELAQGTYTYTLEINGESVDTKLMVVTK